MCGDYNLRREKRYVEVDLCCVKHKKSLTLKRCSRFPTCRYRNI